MRRIGSEKGSMPFAVIAVTILVIAGTYGAVCACIERTNDNVENLSIELDVFDETVEKVRSAVNRGMGEIIADISRTDGGSLMSRSETFDVRAESWMRFQFPMGDGTVTVDLSDFDIAMAGESMMLRSGQDTDASMPVYLKATGTLDVDMYSSSGSASKTISISADGTSSLPLVITQASLFELSVSGERPLLAQLISYQLAALAQYRAIQGYGSTSQYGDRGTESIITEKDVIDAYRNALASIEMICFRTTSDGTDPNSLERTDLAEELICGNGYIELDLTAVFAQSIASQADSLVVRWADYLMFDKILEIIDGLLDALKKIGETVYNAAVGLFNFITGKEVPKITASNHLRATMAELGYSESEYRRLTPGGTIGFRIPGGEYSFDHDGEEYPLVISGNGIVTPSPDKDILDWNGWNGFLDDYRKENNSVREYIRGVLNLICIKVSSSYGLGVVRIPVDAHDDVTFASSLSYAVSSALSAQKADMEEIVAGSMQDTKFTDPMYGAMFKRIRDNKDELFGLSSVKSVVEAAVRNNVKDQINKQYGGLLLDGSVLDEIVADQMGSEEIAGTLRGYLRLAEERVSFFEGILTRVTDSGGVMKEVLALIISKGLFMIDLYPLFERRLNDLSEEIGEHLRINSHDILDLPGVSDFVVSDASGNSHTETMSLIRTEDLRIRITPPTEGHENTHYTDVFEDAHAAAYSATFRIFVSTEISFSVSSQSPMSALLGLKDSVYSDKVRMESDIVVPVMSGWALSGVRYDATDTIWDDAVEFIKDCLDLLKRLLEPILKPLREFCRMVDAVFSIIGSALIELTSYAVKLIERLYGVIADALDRIMGMLSGVTDLFAESLEWIIKVTVGSQTFGFRLYDFEMKVTMNLKEVYFDHKTVLKIEVSFPISSVDLKFVLDLKRDKDGKYSFAGSAGIATETWQICVTLDPLMKIKKHIIEINAHIRNTDIDIVLPEVVQHQELEFRLSDIPGIGTLLSNIPLPVPGMKGSIDAGFELKYNVPFKYGLMINEFEQNPPGTDAGKEWVELYNSTSGSIDLTGYKLMMKSGDDKIHELSGTIGPQSHLVVTFPKQMLNNSLGKKGNGECIVLVDRDGNELDKTPWKTDTKDDNKTWQRKYDGSLEWTFKEATKGSPNGGMTIGSNPLMAMIKQGVMDAAFEVLGKVTLITDVPGIADLLKKVIETAIKKVIEQIAACVVEASVFFEIRASDVTGAAGAGIRLSVLIGPDLIKDGLNWIVNEIKTIAFNIGNPSGVSPATILADDIHIRFTVFTDLRAPKFLGTLSSEGVSISVVVQCNISAVCTLLGKDLGTWSVTAGIVLENVPAEAIPKMIKTDKARNADIWLIRATFHKAR